MSLYDIRSLRPITTVAPNVGPYLLKFLPSLHSGLIVISQVCCWCCVPLASRVRSVKIAFILPSFLFSYSTPLSPIPPICTLPTTTLHPFPPRPCPIPTPSPPHPLTPHLGPAVWMRASHGRYRRTHRRVSALFEVAVAACLLRHLFIPELQ